MFQIILVVTLFCVSLERANSAHLRNVVVDFASEDETFRGNIHVNGKAYPLTLKRAVDSVFAPNFRLTETIRAPSGKIILQDIPLIKSVSEIERNIYVDEDARAAFAMEHVDGEMRLPSKEGIMDNIQISHDGLGHVASIHDLTAVNLKSDYFSTNLTLTKDQSVDERAVTVATSELFFTLDYKRFIDGGRNEQKVPEYLAILVRGASNRYTTVSDPSIKFKIVGSTIIKSRAAQPFIEEARGTADGGEFEMGPALQKFARYMYTLRETNDKDLPQHDQAPLLSTEHFGNTLGITTEGACQDLSEFYSIRVMVVADYNISWFSVETLAHEIAHNLGSNHDGKGSSSACPESDGFLMGNFSRKNHLTFSSCSRNAMKNYINTKEGACLKRDDASEAWPEAPKDPGWYLTMDEACLKRYSDICPDVKASSNRTPDEMCGDLKCRCKSLRKIYRPEINPPNGTPCGSRGGRCHEGKCVA